MTSGQTVPQGVPGEEEEEEGEDGGDGGDGHCLPSVRPHGVSRPSVHNQLLSSVFCAVEIWLSLTLQHCSTGAGAYQHRIINTGCTSVLLSIFISG